MKFNFIILFFALWVNVFANTNKGNEFNKQTQTVDKKELWGESPSESLIQPIMNQFVANEIIKIKPIKNHHFNLKAFNNCQSKKPIFITEQEMQCQFSEPGKYRISLFICDDEKTFCKFQFVHVNISQAKNVSNTQKKSEKIVYKPKVDIKVPNFIVNKPNEAVQKAKKENKPLLIYFAASWCPACNMLNEVTLSSKSLKKKLENYIPLAVDVDSDLSWELKDKFKIVFYPTIVMATPQLSEVNRAIGFKSEPSLSAWLSDSQKLENEPIDFLIAKIKQLEPSKNSKEFKVEYESKKIRLAQWHLERQEYDKVIEILSDVKNKESEFLTLKTNLELTLKTASSDSKEALNKVESILKKLIQDFSDRDEVGDWLLIWAQIKGESQKSFVQNKLKELDSLEASKNFVNRNLNEYYSALGDAALAVGLEDSAKNYFLKCAQIFEKVLEVTPSRGADMERAFCLSKANQNQKALTIFKKLAEQYKTEFAFSYYYAKTLMQENENKEALKFATLALNNSYGDNMIRAATLKAQLELEEKDIIKAEKTLTETLDKVYLPQSTSIRTHRYLTQMRSVLEQVQLIKIGKKEVVQ